MFDTSKYKKLRKTCNKFMLIVAVQITLLGF